ncbi:MAG: glutamine synthetase III [Leptospiraceae bacterium]|nr:glutamine synthetase III [Leptospiraceae bacterium]MDW7976757.1 glutamine synthetase III [Leptospiraceae bacterium]
MKTRSKTQIGKNQIEKYFGSNVFHIKKMKKYLPKETFKAYLKAIENGEPLSLEHANVIAEAMKKWAIKRGATHFTHWFQPMTGFTAEKHDSFLHPIQTGIAITKLSGKQLIKGEPDASSFPSGGLRSTFEARGYTIWDITSPAFIKESSGTKVLCIPTAFISYNGDALDKKTPLLRSMEVLSNQVIRVLRLLGNTTSKRAYSTVGPEQEYFLIDRKYFEKRLDLIITGRTLFGARPPKGQEMEDHYFGSIKERISEFMQELDNELWKMGVSAKTRHNEVAPAQHEIAPNFENANIAVDHNQIIMETLKKVANRHGLVCLLHEKPFLYVNGSGKHNNWSIQTDDGINLLDPGTTPHENHQFLIFLVAVIKAIDDYADLLRVSAATPGNDFRLGANEAPPAIISIYLGDMLTSILEKIEKREMDKIQYGTSNLDIGISQLLHLPKDNTDRNRTSPFAFTGNKFEFRMVPSTASIAAANFTLNSIVAETLSQIADRLEAELQKNNKSLEEIILDIVADIYKKHKRIIFNGNNYSQEWVEEAKRRGLPNITNTVDAAKAIIAEKNVRMYEKLKVFNKRELESRYEIVLENYIKTIRIEANTMLTMARQMIQPAVNRYIKEIADTIIRIEKIQEEAPIQRKLLRNLNQKFKILDEKIQQLEKAIEGENQEFKDTYEHACYMRDAILNKAMKELREIVDELELMVDKNYWPMPDYTDLLFRV